MKDVYVIVEFVKSNSAAVMPTNWFYDKKKKGNATGQKNLKAFPSETKLLKKCGLHIKIERHFKYALLEKQVVLCIFKTL